MSVFVISVPVMYPLAETKTDTEVESYETITLGDIQQELTEYLADNQPEIKLGTNLFYEYAMDQLIYDTDTVLSAKKNYSLIHAYLAEYVNEIRRL